MQTATLIIMAWFTSPPLPLDVEDDVRVIDHASFVLPMYPEAPHKIVRLRLYCSDDQGKSWKLVKELREGGDVEFHAPRDGLYWFAGQVVLEKRVEPPDTAKLRPTMKIYVNSAKRPVKIVAKSNAELTRAVRDLRDTIDGLNLRIRELEEAQGKKK